MNLDALMLLVNEGRLMAVNFIESGCGPIVMQVEASEGAGESVKTLMKDDKDQVMTFRSLAQGYELCRLVGVHQANLLQTIPHDEACAGSYTGYDQNPMPLRF